MATRQERIRERMRGAGRVDLGDIDFGFAIPIVPDYTEEADEEEQLPDAHADQEPSSPGVSSPTPAPPPPPAAAPVTRPTPNTSAKRIHIDKDGRRSGLSPLGDPMSISPRPRARPETRSPTSSRGQPSSLRGMSLPPPSEDEDEAEGEDEDVEDMEVDTPAVDMDDAEPEPEDVNMEDAPVPPLSIKQHQLIQQRGPLSSVIAATKRIAIHSSPEEVVMESPADAPGSGKRQRLHDVSPVVGSSALLQKVLADLNDSSPTRQGGQAPPSSSPVERRVRARIRRSKELKRMSESVGSNSSQTVRTTRRSVKLSGSGSSVVAPEEDVERSEALDAVEEAEDEAETEEEEDHDLGADGDEMEVEDSVIGQVEEDQPMDEEPIIPEPTARRSEEPEPEEAQEIDDQQAAQRLGKTRSRRNVPAPSPELDTEEQVVEPPGLRKRKRKELASPAQQQQPAKKTRASKPPLSQPSNEKPVEKSIAQEKPKSQEKPKPREREIPQEKPKPQEKAKLQETTKPQEREKPREKPSQREKPRAKSKKQPAKRKNKSAAEEEPAEGKSGSVSVTVQRYVKPRAPREGENGSASVLDTIPLGNRGGVNAIDVLSKLCEELVETYMEKLQEAAMAAKDSASRREKKTMLRALDAFREELRTRLLEQTISLDTLHALRKRVRAAQKEKISLRDEIMRVRAERDQVALRMDAIRLRHEIESKEALRDISLSSVMHDIDLAVEKGQAAPELSDAEQKQADLANLELLVNQVADQASSKSDGGGTLRQIKEFNAFLERAAAILEGRRV
ncbi:hypothetical protein QBC38DRAFT_85089 [Podospora fimiseda]|uniref:Inner kinetochore subunit AME1 domain-containing protein n=1 Tax=Podospora fimiseda TaxID=252190 RepID=A0AAN7H5L2_9PEZI|nr:hypothetical protein QBC38DRAFT_85089 [Podospora fimiseda]